MGLQRAPSEASDSTMDGFLQLDLEKGHCNLVERMAPSPTFTPSTSSSASSCTGGTSLHSTQLAEKPAPTVQPRTSFVGRCAARIYHCIRYEFTLYRQIFAFILTANLAVLVAFLVWANGSLASTSAGSAAAVNLMVGVLFRQEQVVNASFWLLAQVPRSWPLCIRRKAAKVFHYGGIHSGCGVAAVMWYLLCTALTTKEFVQSPTNDGLEALITAWILVALFMFLVGGAHPKFRVKFHDNFEVLHRFSGWTALAVFWAHVLFTADRAAAATSSSMGMALVRDVSFWSIVLATLPIVTSWAQLRRRAVRAEKLSDHATRLHFDHATLPSCFGVRVSTNPLMEWHSFATIPNIVPKDPARAAGGEHASAAPAKAGFSLVVSNAGDWTSGVICQAPTHLWMRGSPLRGVIYTARLFHKVVVVATGSGIGPCLSLLVCHESMLPSRPRVLWSAPSPLRTFGADIVASVNDADPEAVIWDTKKMGRPDLVHEAEKLARESGAEAVFCISNPKVCKMLVDGLEDRGIAAYAPIFDS